MFKIFEQNSELWVSRKGPPTWCRHTTRGCPTRSKLIVAGSKQTAYCKKVQLLDIVKESVKDLPDLLIPSACVGMTWDSTNNAVILAGGDQDKDGNGDWKMTDQMFRLTNVGREDSKWELLTCKLPMPMADPELLMSDSHLYLVFYDLSCIRVQRIPKDKLMSDLDTCDWENLPCLKYPSKPNIRKRGAVFIQNKVVVFTLGHIMILNLDVTPPKWNTVRIGAAGTKDCIPRMLNDEVILLLMQYEKPVLELYDPMENISGLLLPSSRGDQEVDEATFVPWKFFVMHG